MGAVVCDGKRRGCGLRWHSESLCNRRTRVRSASGGWYAHRHHDHPRRNDRHRRRHKRPGANRGATLNAVLEFFSAGVVVPSTLGTIRNFAWVVPGVLARGEQPQLEPTIFAALREAGVTTVLSLRPDREPPSANASRPWPEYFVEQERALAEQAGMRFEQFPLEDFSAPPPERI